jgi:alanine racemase
MNTRTQDRLKLLEAKLAPKGRHFVFTHFVDDEEPDAPSRDERLAAFKAENGVAPSDLIHEVTVTFA